MMKGIYCYIDIKTGVVVYIGKDSHIDRKNRYYAHKSPSHYDKQPFNRVIQNNPKSLEEEVKRRGLEWTIIDENKAKETLKLDK